MSLYTTIYYILYNYMLYNYMLYICRKIAAALCIVVLGACITSIYHVHSVDGNSSAVIGIGGDPTYRLSTVSTF